MKFGFVNTFSGRYIVPYWIKVPEDTTFENAKQYIPKDILEKERKLTISRFKVPGKKYIITRVGSKWKCSCLGFMYHKNCIHMKTFEENFKKELEAA